MSTGDAMELNNAPPLVGGGAPEAGRLGGLLGYGRSILCPGTSLGKRLCSGLGKGLGGHDAVPCILRLGAASWQPAVALLTPWLALTTPLQLGTPLRLAPFRAPCPLTYAHFNSLGA